MQSLFVNSKIFRVFEKVWLLSVYVYLMHASAQALCKILHTVVDEVRAFVVVSITACITSGGICSNHDGDGLAPNLPDHACN